MIFRFSLSGAHLPNQKSNNLVSRLSPYKPYKVRFLPLFVIAMARINLS